MTLPNMIVLDSETLTGTAETADQPQLSPWSDETSSIDGLNPSRSVVTDVQLATSDALYHLRLAAACPDLVENARGQLVQSLMSSPRERCYQLDSTPVYELTFLHESTLLRETGMLIDDLRFDDNGRTPADLLVTWNGSVFDLPFLADRAEINGTTLGDLQLAPDPARQPKYQALPGHDRNGASGAYKASWHGLPHLDVAYVYQQYARANDVDWSLKPVAASRGIDMITVDRARMHQLDEAARSSYALSDVVGLQQLVQSDFQAMNMSAHIDR